MISATINILDAIMNNLTALHIQHIKEYLNARTSTVRKLLVTGKLPNSDSEHNYRFDEQGNSTGLNKDGYHYKDVNGNDISTNPSDWDGYSIYGGLDSWLDSMVAREEKLAEEDEAHWKENIEPYLDDYIDAYDDYLGRLENIKE